MDGQPTEVEVTVTFRCVVEQIAEAPDSAKVLVDQLTDQFVFTTVGALEVLYVFSPGGGGVRVLGP